MLHPRSSIVEIEREVVLVGDILGNQSARAREGATIHAGVGAVGGGALGSAKDDREGY